MADAGAAADAGTSGAVTCEEGADVSRVDWQLIRDGLDDFVFNDASASSGARGLAGIAFGNGTWLIVGESRQSDDTRIHWATSSDGVHWQSASQVAEGGVVGVLSPVFFVDGQFLLFVEQGQSDRPTSVSRFVPYTSTDGRSWNAHPVTGLGYVWGVASDGARVLAAAGGDSIWSSEDLNEWAQHSPIAGVSASSSAGAKDVIYGDGRFIANVGVSSIVNRAYQGEGRLYASTDADHWTRIELDGFDELALSYGGGVWIVTDWNGAYRTSSDGETFTDVSPTGAWLPATRRGLGGDQVRDLVKLRFAGGRFIRARADDEQTPPSRIQFISSVDGERWSDFGEVPGMPLPSGAYDVEYRISGVAYADCRYVIVGTYSVLVPGALDPPPFTSEIGPFLATAVVR